MPRGIRTSEFWVTILTDAGLVCSSLAGQLPPKWAAVGAAAAQLAYAISRGIAKHGSASGSG